MAPPDGQFYMGWWLRRLRRVAIACARALYLRTVCAPIALWQVAYARIRVWADGRAIVSAGRGERDRNFLIIALDHLGDASHALPLILGLQRALPDVQLTVVASKSVAPLFEAVQGCRVVPLSATGGKLRRWLALPRERYRFARDQLGRGKFGLCVIPRRDADYQCAVLLGYFSLAPIRISFTEKATAVKRWQNCGYDHLLTHAMEASLEPEAEAIYRLLSAVVPDATVQTLDRLPIPDPAWVEGKLGAGRDWIAICPSEGSSGIKQWGARRWTKVADALSQRGYGIVLVGGGDDVQIAQDIMTGIRGVCVNLVGSTTLRQLASVLAISELFLGNDCGPMQLASAVNCPTVAVMGSTCAHRFGAWAERSASIKVELPCSPCRTHRSDRCTHCIYRRPKCLEAVSPEQVLAAALRLLGISALQACDPTDPGPGNPLCPR